MASPQRVYDDDADDQYSPQGNETMAPNAGRPDLHGIQGGGETTPRKTGHLKSVDSDRPKSYSGDELNNAESGDDIGSNGQNENSETPEAKEASNMNFTGGAEGEESSLGGARMSKRQKKYLLGGGGLFLGGGLAAFFMVIPGMRLEIFMNQVNQRAFGLVENAVEHRISRHIEKYLVSRVFPSVKGECGNTVSNKCTSSHRNTAAGRLYDSWQDGRIEERLLERHGIKIEHDKNSVAGQDRFRIFDAKGNSISLDQGKISQGGWIMEGGPGENVLGRELRKYIRAETKWYQWMQRKSVHNWGKRKHGLNDRCFWKHRCDKKDERSNKWADARTNLKRKIVRRIVYPMSSKYGIIIECVMAGEATCDKDKITGKVDDIPDAELDEIFERHNASPNRKLSQVVVEGLIEKTLKTFMTKTSAQTAARSISSSVPVAGQIYFGLTILDMANEIRFGIENNTLGKFASQLNAKQYVEYYMAMRSASDEAKAGDLNFAEVGAMASQFDNMGDSMVYQAYQPSAEVASGLFGSKALAATETDEGYKCKNDKPIQKGDKVCAEKKVAVEFFFEKWADSELFKLVSSTSAYEVGCNAETRKPSANPLDWRCIRAPVHGALDAINWVVDEAGERAMSAAEWTIQHSPLAGAYASFQTWVKESMGSLVSSIFEEVFPLPVREESPDRENHDGVVAGSQVSAMEMAKGGYAEGGEPYGLGSRAVSRTQALAILNDVQAQRDYEYNDKSYFARMFDMENPNSTFSRVVMNTPTQPSQYATVLASSFSDVFSGRLFGGLATSPFASAAVDDPNVLVESPFGVNNYGYPPGDAGLNIDPDNLDDASCATIKQTWESEEHKSEDPITGFDEYDITNPCLLDKVAMESSGSGYSNAFDENPSGGTPNSTPTTAGAQIVGDPFETSESVACAAGTKDLGIHDAYRSGNPIKHRLCAISEIANPSAEIPEAEGKAIVNSRVSGAVKAMAVKAATDGITLFANSSFRTMAKQEALWIQYGMDTNRVARPGFSPHQSGVALDIEAGGDGDDRQNSDCGANRDRADGNPVWEWLVANAPAFGYGQYSAESWHWDPDEGRCK